MRVLSLFAVAVTSGLLIGWVLNAHANSPKEGWPLSSSNHCKWWQMDEGFCSNLCQTRNGPSCVQNELWPTVPNRDCECRRKDGSVDKGIQRGSGIYGTACITIYGLMTDNHEPKEAGTVCFVELPGTRDQGKVWDPIPR